MVFPTIVGIFRQSRHRPSMCTWVLQEGTRREAGPLVEADQISEHARRRCWSAGRRETRQRRMGIPPGGNREVTGARETSQPITAGSSWDCRQIWWRTGRHTSRVTCKPCSVCCWLACTSDVTFRNAWITPEIYHWAHVNPHPHHLSSNGESNNKTWYRNNITWKYIILYLYTARTAPTESDFCPYCCQLHPYHLGPPNTDMECLRYCMFYPQSLYRMKSLVLIIMSLLSAETILANNVPHPPIPFEPGWKAVKENGIIKTFVIFFFWSYHTHCGGLHQ